MKQVMRESLLIKLPVIIGDLFLLNLSWILALTLYPQPACIARSLEIFAYLNICFIPGLSWFGVILSSRIVPYEEIIRRVFYVVLCHLGFFVLIQTVWSYGLLPVHLMGTFYIVLTVLLMLWRYICRIVVNVTRGHGRNARRVIIVGSKDNAVEVYHEMVDNTSTGYRVLGYFSNHNDHTLPDNTPCLGSVDEALPWLEAHPVNEVYCCLSTDRYAEEIFPIMDFCENNFVRFFYVPNLRNYMKRTMNLELLGNVPILYIREEPLRQASNRFIKRAFDVTVSSLFLCTLFPFIYIFVAIGTKLTSRGSSCRSAAGRTARRSGALNSVRCASTPMPTGCRRPGTTRARPGSGISCAGRASTSCPSSSTCSRATCPSWGRGRTCSSTPSNTRNSSTNIWFAT